MKNLVKHFPGRFTDDDLGSDWDDAEPITDAEHMEIVVLPANTYAKHVRKRWATESGSKAEFRVGIELRLRVHTIGDVEESCGECGSTRSDPWLDWALDEHGLTLRLIKGRSQIVEAITIPLQSPALEQVIAGDATIDVAQASTD